MRRAVRPAAVVAASLAAAAAAQDPAPESRFAGLLRELAGEADPAEHCCLNGRRAALLEAQLGSYGDPRMLAVYAEEALRAGETESAIRRLEEYLELLLEVGMEPGSPEVRDARGRLAVAWLRLGEQDNCLQHHGAESCLLPIRGGGIHRVPRGARGAIAQLERLLEGDPDDLAHRWLLNLAYMALGEYPEGVPERHRIPESVFEDGSGFPRFTDRAPQLGLAVNATSGGAILDDFDGDGALDVIASSWGLEDQLRYFASDGRGGFEERTAEAGLLGETGGLNLVQADYDNDGDLDVLVLRGAWLGAQGLHPNSLLRNDGAGGFENVTTEAGLLSRHPTQTAAWADYDGDGWLDLFVGNESTGGEAHPCELFRNRGDGRFEEVAAAVGLDHAGFVKGAVWGDYDNDGRPDLYLSQLGQPNRLFHNDGPGADATGWRFSDVTEAAGVAEPLRSFPTWFWDYDNDGWLDLLAAPYSGFTASSLAAIAAHRLGRASDLERLRLYRNLGDGTFRDVAPELGLDEPLLAMGANYGDLDDDGFPDAYFGTGEPALATLVPNRAFRNDGGRRFEEVTFSGGFGHLQKGHGVAFGDVDGDGDQDVYAVMGGAYSGDVYPNALFVNPGNDNRRVTLLLEGTESNRSAIGARVAVVVREGERERTVRALVGSGGSFGASSLRQELGLGRAEGVLRVEILWPGSAEREAYRGVPLDGAVRIRQGDPEPVPLPAAR